MANLLCLETATETCSVAIFDDQNLLGFAQSQEPYNHAAQITLLIDECLQSARMTLDEIEGIIVSEGPGSYTGLRVGVSAAKGLCFTRNLPLIAVDTLKALAYGSMLEHSNQIAKRLFCPMIDARRKEVYTGLYDNNLENLMPPQALILSEKSFESFFNLGYQIVFSGNGCLKFKEICPFEEAIFSQVRSSAKHFIKISHLKFAKKHYSDLIYFSPKYIKAPHITTAKKLI